MIDPRDMPISDALLDLVPRALVFECTIFPAADDGHSLTLLCCSDNPDLQHEETDRIEFLINRKVKWLPVERDLLERLIYNRFPLAHAEIQNCEPEFRFKCPKTWESLTETDNAKNRMCTECGRPVTWTDDAREAQRLGAAGECVAFSDARAAETLGMIGPD
jgi:hypothetical protein